MNFSIIEMKENFVNMRKTEKEKREEKANKMLEKMFIDDCSVLAEILENPDNYEDVNIYTRYNKKDGEVMEIQLKTPFNIIVRTIFNSWFRFKDESYMNIDNTVITDSFYMVNAFLIIPKQRTESYDTVISYFIDKLKNDPMKLISKLSLQGARF